LALDGAGELVFGGLTAIDSGFHFHKKADSYLINLEVGCAKVRRRPTVFGSKARRDFAVLFTVSAVLGKETSRAPLNSPNAALQGDQMGEGASCRAGVVRARPSTIQRSSADGVAAFSLFAIRNEGRELRETNAQLRVEA
jgi:hypothetical protein